MVSESQVSASFRDATLNDVSFIVDLVQSSYRGVSSRTGWTTEADLLEGQRIDSEGVVEIIEAPKSRIVLLDTDSRIIGCCQLEDRGKQGAYLGLFSVSPKHQGQGLGRILINEVERIAVDELQARQMIMSVINQRSELIAWYERLGYKRTGETLPFPYGDERFGTPKRDDLTFVVLSKSLV